MKVDKIVKETEDASTIYFDVADDLENEFLYEAGQYLTLKFNIDGKEERRSYSICTSPIEKELAVNVKRVKKGVISNHINDMIKEGDRVEVMVPEGNFTIDLKENESRDFFFFTAGSGITPVIALVKTILEQEPKSNVFLLYGNRDENSIIFKDELDSMSQKYEGQFGLTHTLSNPLKRKKRRYRWHVWKRGNKLARRSWTY